MNKYQICRSDVAARAIAGLCMGAMLALPYWSSTALAQAESDQTGSEQVEGGAPVTGAPEPATPPSDLSKTTEPAQYHFTVGAGIKASSLGGGFDLAVPVTHNTNVRIGYSGFIDIDDNFNRDDIDYQGKLKFHSLDALFDYFPFSGVFHLSAGFTYGSIIKARADASAASGTTFSLNHTEYTSSDNDPVTGHAAIDFRKFAPMVTVGWGNLVPRQGRFSLSFEVGAVFQGSGRSKLNLAGSACQGDGDCPSGNINVATDPTVQSNIMAEQGKLDHEVKAFDVYPVISLGLGYRFQL